jgi:hypothetical protein
VDDICECEHRVEEEEDERWTVAEGMNEATVGAADALMINFPQSR